MADRVYAFLVGINAYDRSKIGPLEGCVGDVDRFHDYLKDRFDPSTLNVEILKDGDATYANIVNTFRTFLGRAEKDDVALFQYCGHGAQWAAAPEFASFFPSGKDETLVCVDSRVTDAYDLADKEMAVLLHEVAAKGPHITAIFDSCHSGSVTRHVDDFTLGATRRTHEVNEPRPLDSYLDGFYAKQWSNDSTFTIPKSRHISLAACDRHQQAKETARFGGVFSATLMDVLTEAGREANYADLFSRCRVVVRKRARDQDPQFDSYHGFNPYAGFLGGSTLTRAPRHLVYFDTKSNGGEWVMERGAVHGLPDDPDKTIRVELYAGDDGESAGSARVESVRVQESSLILDQEPEDRDAKLKAEVCELPVAPLIVRLQGDERGVDAMEAATSLAVPVAFVEPGTDTSYVLTAETEDGPDRFVLEREDPPIQIEGRLTDGFSENSADYMMSVLKRVAQWERLLELQNRHTRMDPSKVALWLTASPEGEPEIKDEDGELTLLLDRAPDDPDAWGEVDVRLEARNDTEQKLYLALFHFSEDFGISTLYNDELGKGERAILYDEGALTLEEGRTQTEENFRLFVSTEKLDAHQLEMEPIPLVAPPDVKKRSLVRRKKTYLNEWFTKGIRVRTVGRANQLGEQAVEVGGAITIKPHAGLRGSVALTAAPTNTRAAGGGVHRVFESKGLELMSLSGTRAGGEGGAEVLELTDLQNTESLAEHPLEIQIDAATSENESIVPMTFDGEHFVVVGETETDDDGRTLVTISEIPESTIPDGRRSLGSALKLYFFRTYFDRDDTALRWIEYDADGNVVERHTTGIADKVKEAENVILLVHGIIGDTKMMAVGAGRTVEDHGSIADHFDLVLTYDYENLSRPIQETAQDLRTRLADAGLKADDGKRLTILAHSMGGLVSRWMIERMGGADTVDHLVLCGTPSGGSPFGHVGDARKLLTVLTNVAVNASSLMALAPAAMFVLNRSKKLTVTLEQMKSGSDFLDKLESSDDPGVPYTILAGDIRDYTGESDEGFAKLLNTAGKGFALEKMHGTGAHDIAVGLESIYGVPLDRVPSPQSTEVACHHLNYFVSTAGLEALSGVSWT